MLKDIPQQYIFNEILTYFIQLHKDKEKAAHFKISLLGRDEEGGFLQSGQLFQENMVF